MNGAPQDDRFAPPQAHVEDVPVSDGTMALASRLSRLWAALVDMVVVMTLLGIAAAVTPWNPWAQPKSGYWVTPQLAGALGGYLVFMLANGWLLVTRGQTIGKALLKIRIVRPDGSAASPGRLLGLRYGVGSLAAIFPALGQAWSLLDTLFIFRESRRCLHDQIADTVVLKA